VTDQEFRAYRRTPAPELRDGETPTISGAASVYNQVSQNLGGFVEQFAPGAFTRTLDTADGVVATFNHNPSQLLGRVSAGNLKLQERDTGLYYDVKPPDTTAGRDAVVNVRAGLVTGSSFTFRAVNDTWGETENGYSLRTVTEAALYEVGPVTNPAYLQTSSGSAALAVRSFCTHHDIDPESIPSLMPADLRDFLHTDEIEEIAGVDEPEIRAEQIGEGGGVPVPAKPKLTVARARLVLLEMQARHGYRPLPTDRHS
jgi:HK97 family phage prohead protease